MRRLGCFFMAVGVVSVCTSPAWLLDLPRAWCVLAAAVSGVLLAVAGVCVWAIREPWD